MPIPPSLRAAFGERAFWDAYYSRRVLDPARPDLDGARVEFRPAEDYGLAVRLEDPVDTIYLEFQARADAAPVELGLECSRHTMGNVLRWDEVDRIGRAVALRDPSLGHPGLAVALLAPFAKVWAGEDVDVIFPLLEAALRGLGVLTERDVDNIIDRLDCRSEEITWRPREPHGWLLHLAQELREGIDYEYFSTRVDESWEENGRVPFPHDAWAGMLDEARRSCVEAISPRWLAGRAGELAREVARSGDLAALSALADALEAAGCDHPTILEACRDPSRAARACWVVEELVGLEPGGLIRRHFGPTARHPRRYSSISVYVPISREAYARDPGLAATIRSALRRALAEDDVGIVFDHHLPAIGDRREVEGVEEYLNIFATSWDDPARKLEAVRQVLLAAGPPPGTRLRFSDDTAADQYAVAIRPGEA